ncbi:hypothetical protein JTP67_31670, partial [Streptomyces sp. S12]|nr:hypothetical protein [Streptomyces sp. S12]
MSKWRASDCMNVRWKESLRRELGDQLPHLLGVDLVLGAVQAVELAGFLGHAHALEQLVDAQVVDAA